MAEVEAQDSVRRMQGEGEEFIRFAQVSGGMTALEVTD